VVYLKLLNHIIQTASAATADQCYINYGNLGSINKIDDKPIKKWRD